MLREVKAQRWREKEFHRFMAATLKALSPTVPGWEEKTASKSQSSKEGMQVYKKYEVRYVGWAETSLVGERTLLYGIWKRKGSQCNFEVWVRCVPTAFGTWPDLLVNNPEP